MTNQKDYQAKSNFVKLRVGEVEFNLGLGLGWVDLGLTMYLKNLYPDNTPKIHHF